MQFLVGSVAYMVVTHVSVVAAAAVVAAAVVVAVALRF
jgi:hypothetical protein